MKKSLKFIQACPEDAYYIWQVHLWLESLKEIGHSDKAVNLIFSNKGSFNPKWKEIEKLYPEAEFHYYKDEHNINRFLPTYIPLLRPYVLSRYFQDFPENCVNAIFYCDSDILFTKDFNVDNFINDDVCYLSNTNSYISASYFDSKIKDVIPEKLEEYKTRDILAEVMSVVGVGREIAEHYNDHSGGAQYLLKNVDSAFWAKVFNDCLTIRKYLQNVNKYFFESEEKGFQSWCADMWAVLWNLWFKEKETKVIEEMNFAWSTDPISRLNDYTILHNAGVTGNDMGDCPMFYKGAYHQGQNPLKDPHITTVLNNEKSKSKCNWYYLNKLVELHEKYKIEY